MIADRAHPHAARAHRDDLVVEVGEAPPMLGDQPRETSPPDPAGSSAAPSSSPSERPWARSRRSDWQVSSRAQEPRRPRPARPPDARPARRSRCAPRAPSPGRPAARRARTPHPAHLPRGAGPERPSQWPCDDPPRSIIMSSHTGALTVPREGSRIPSSASRPAAAASAAFETPRHPLDCLPLRRVDQRPAHPRRFATRPARSSAPRSASSATFASNPVLQRRLSPATRSVLSSRANQAWPAIRRAGTIFQGAFGADVSHAMLVKL